MIAHIATVAILASAAIAANPGQVTIKNQCAQDCYLDACPALGGEYTEAQHVIKSGDQWTQTWTNLHIDGGWSLKVNNITDGYANPIQFEYTWTGDNTLWYDMSRINGNPYGADWLLTSGSDGCKPKQTAYDYPTDDKHAMQDCSCESDITLTLCPNDSPASSSPPATTSAAATSPSAYSPPAYSTPSTTSQAPAPTSTEAPTTSAAPSTSEAPSSTHEAPPAYTHHHWTHDRVESSSAPAPTTFATQTTEANGDVVTVIDTAYVTDYVTETHWVRDVAPTAAPAKKRRHQHHPHAHRA